MDAEPGSSSSVGGAENGVREQDRFLPIANINRIMKKGLPTNAKIAKEAKETVQECVSEFISFITSEASDKCQREKRKTINGDDLLWALGALGFEEYVEPLKLFLSKHRESESTYCQNSTTKTRLEIKQEEDSNVMSFVGEDEDGSFSKSELVPPDLYASYVNGFTPPMTNQNPYASNR
eukprot:g8237.t1